MTFELLPEAEGIELLPEAEGIELLPEAEGLGQQFKSHP